MERKNETSVALNPKEVVLTRSFDAPKALMYKAFTEAEHVSKWWGPHGFTTECSIDLRVGGRYSFVMKSKEGELYPVTGKYLEIVPNERIVFDADAEGHPQEWKDQLRDDINGAPDEDMLKQVMKITFEEKDGKTLLNIYCRFHSDAIRDGYIKLGMKEGWSESLERLAGEVEKMK